MNKSIIEINGQKYNSANGVMIKSQSMSDISAPKKNQKSSPNPIESNKKNPDIHRSNNNLKTLQSKKSTTLNRSGVSKPILHNVAQANVAPKPSLNMVNNSARQDRMRLINKSPNLAKFHTPASLPVVPVMQPLELASPKEVLELPEHSAVYKAPATRQSHIERFMNTQEAVDPIVSFKRKRTSLRTKLVAASMLLLVGSGVGLYSNVNRINHYFASKNAGIQSTLPSVPSGLHIGSKINSSNGKIDYRILSNYDQSSLKVSQELSDLSSTSLEQKLAAEKTKFTKVEKNGMTIYNTDKGESIWINAGLKNSVSGSLSLTDTQLLDLANSLQ
jgi:hypothetical protein